MKQFYMDIEKLDARHKIIVVDACFSGQAGNGQSLIKYASPALLRVNNPLVADSNTVIFQSSGPDQVSNWYDEKRHGMFTYFFLKGLQGAADFNHDGTITADELIKYINDPNDGLPYYSNRLYQRPQEAHIEGDGQTVIERIEK
ncbi:MAG: caspase family protein [Bacteroidetes bacterium]|nr:caspase family protein [Bacteroidota bacterium]